MKTFPSKIVTIWILGCFAVLHAAALYLSHYSWLMMGPHSEWLARVWMAFALLWFVWPVILTTHSAHSRLRVILPLTIAAPFVYFFFQAYSTEVGPEVLRLPFGVWASPQDLAKFGFWYAAGWVDAKRDARAGRIVFEGYGLGFGAPRIPTFSEEVSKRCGIEYLATSGCEVNEHIVGHAYGRNDANLKQLKQRFGEKVITDAEEAEKKYGQDFEAAFQLGRSDAARDINAGHFVLEVFGSTSNEGPDYEKTLRQQYKIELKHVAGPEGCHADPKITGHAHGYNDVTKPEIERRFGSEAYKLVLEAESKYAYVGFRDKD